MIHPVSIYPSVSSCIPLSLCYPPCLHHFLPPPSLPPSFFLTQRRAERESQFNKMSYNDADRAKWRKVLSTQLISSDESATEDDQPVLIIKELRWRSEKVTIFFQKLDRAHDARKSEQACRQTKRRVRKGVTSNRPAPSGFPAWAVPK